MLIAARVLEPFLVPESTSPDPAPGLFLAISIETSSFLVGGLAAA